MLNSLKNVEFFIRNDLVVTGHNPEMADYDNRDGAIFGEGYYIVARSESGLQWAHGHTFVNDSAGAERLLKAITARGEVNEAYWQEIEPQYGTGAWLTWNGDHPETWND